MARGGRPRRYAACAATAAFVACCAHQARAQTALDDQVCTSYPSPEYKPIGAVPG